jgi:hypothetical protein
MIPIVKNPGAASKAPAARRSNRKRETTEREAVRHNRGSNRLVLAARSFAARITNCELTDQAAADLAAQWRLAIDAQECRVVEWFAPAKQAAFRAHAAICRQENEAVTPYRGRAARTQLEAGGLAGSSEALACRQRNASRHRLPIWRRA